MGVSFLAKRGLGRNGFQYMHLINAFMEGKLRDIVPDDLMVELNKAFGYGGLKSGMPDEELLIVMLGRAPVTTQGRLVQESGTSLLKQPVERPLAATASALVRSNAAERHKLAIRQHGAFLALAKVLDQVFPEVSETKTAMLKEKAEKEAAKAAKAEKEAAKAARAKAKADAAEAAKAEPPPAPPTPEPAPEPKGKQPRKTPSKSTAKRTAAQRKPKTTAKSKS